MIDGGAANLREFQDFRNGWLASRSSHFAVQKPASGGNILLKLGGKVNVALWHYAPT